MDKAPCLNCTERYVGCHSKCKKYTDFKSNASMQKASDKRAKELLWYSYMKQRKNKGVK